MRIPKSAWNSILNSSSDLDDLGVPPFYLDI